MLTEVAGGELDPHQSHRMTLAGPLMVIHVGEENTYDFLISFYLSPFFVFFSGCHHCSKSSERETPKTKTRVKIEKGKENTPPRRPLCGGKLDSLLCS